VAVAAAEGVGGLAGEAVDALAESEAPVASAALIAEVVDTVAGIAVGMVVGRLPRPHCRDHLLVLPSTALARTAGSTSPVGPPMAPCQFLGLDPAQTAFVVRVEPRPAPGRAAPDLQRACGQVAELPGHGTRRILLTFRYLEAGLPAQRAPVPALDWQAERWLQARPPNSYTTLQVTDFPTSARGPARATLHLHFPRVLAVGSKLMAD
jgi:hypothetical protein